MVDRTGADDGRGSRAERQGADDQLVLDAIAASNAPTIEPVTILLVPDHSYVKGPKGARGCKAQTSAGVNCGRAKADPLHNLPTSSETLEVGWEVYQGAKKKWQPHLIELLEASGLPRGLGSVLVEGQATYPTRARRDQGNARSFIEKALGDALTEGGWIEDDDWTRYEFGGFAYRYVKGERSVALRLFPNALGEEG